MKDILMPPSGEGENIIFEKIHSMVIVGANGSGKSRLGYWMEMHQPNDVFIHRLSAQRSLELSETVFPENLEEAERSLFYGTSSEKVLKRNKKDPKAKRWASGPISGMLYDIDELISLLFAHDNERNRQFINIVKKSKNKTISKEKLDKSLFDKLQEVWQKLLPHRDLIIEEQSISIEGYNDTKYNASQMSDGERVLLYLIGHALCVPSNATIIVDEPELHIHKAIHTRLWNELEKLRSDCLFVYITHDLEFAASRTNATKICLKSFNGESWQWIEVPKNTDIPENIFLEILGSRESIIFIEGQKESLDQEIYGHVYPDFTLMPVESCKNVIDFCRTFNSMDKFHYIKTYGLIDRDYRDDDEIQALQKRKIFTLNLAEVENLFLLENVIKVVAEQLCVPNPDKVFNNIKEFVISEFKKYQNDFAEKVVISEVRRTLRKFDKNLMDFRKTEKSLKELSNFDFDSKKKISTDDAKELIKTKNYEGIIKVFNHKGLVAQIGRYMGLKTPYSDKVQQMIHSGKIEIINEIKKVLPNIKS